MNHRLFASLLSKRLFPHLRAEGFRGSGATLRRVAEPVVEVFNVQGGSGGDRCYLNLGLHLAFLPPEGGQLVELGELKESNCAFRSRIDPPPGQSFGQERCEREAEQSIAPSPITMRMSWSDCFDPRVLLGAALQRVAGASSRLNLRTGRFARWQPDAA